MFERLARCTGSSARPRCSLANARVIGRRRVANIGVLLFALVLASASHAFMSTPTKKKRPAPRGAEKTPSKRKSPHFDADAKGAFPPVLDADVPPHTLLLGTQPSDNSLNALGTCATGTCW